MGTEQVVEVYRGVEIVTAFKRGRKLYYYGNTGYMSLDKVKEAIDRGNSNSTRGVIYGCGIAALIDCPFNTPPYYKLRYVITSKTLRGYNMGPIEAGGIFLQVI